MMWRIFILLFYLWFLAADQATSNKSFTLGSNVVKSNRRPNTFQCFICFWSTNDEPCGDLNFTLKKSTPEKFMFNCLACYKIARHKANGAKVEVLRGCAQESPHYALSCQKIFNQDGSYTETCACSGLYCNMAVGSYSRQQLTIVSAVIFSCFLLHRKLNGA